MAKKKSTVLPFLQMVWKNAQKATDHSWGRLNTTMQKALQLAIGAGFEFVPGDFEGLEEFRPGYWMGVSDEWAYSMAIAEGNFSAATAFEAWKKREPIIADKVDTAPRHDSYAHTAGSRDKERLHVGCYFLWKGERAKVTSFTTQGSAIAVHYHPAKGQYDHERKVKRRFCITREDVITERAEMKERDSLQKQMLAVVEAGKLKSADVLEMLGVKDKVGYATLSLAKIRKVAEKVQARVAA